MPVTEELTTEIAAAVEEVVAKPEQESAKADAIKTEAQTSEDGKPAPETVIEHEDESEGEVVESEKDDAVVVESKDESTTAAESTKPTISDHALTQAARAGIPIEDARSFKSDESLLRVVSVVQRAAEAQVSTVAKQAEEKDLLDDLPKLDPEKYEPEVIAMFDALTGVVRKQQESLKAFQAQSEQVTRAGQATAAQEVERWFDGKVNSLGSDFEEALGKGAYGALNRGSPQFAKREAVANQVAVLLAGYNAAGQKAPSRDEVFDSAARLVLRDEYQKLSEKKLAGDLAKRSSQHIQRAGGQKNKTNQSPAEEVAAMLDEKFFSKK